MSEIPALSADNLLHLESPISYIDYIFNRSHTQSVGHVNHLRYHRSNIRDIRQFNKEPRQATATPIRDLHQFCLRYEKYRPVFIKECEPIDFPLILDFLLGIDSDPHGVGSVEFERLMQRLFV